MTPGPLFTIPICVTARKAVSVNVACPVTTYSHPHIITLMTVPTSPGIQWHPHLRPRGARPSFIVHVTLPSLHGSHYNNHLLVSRYSSILWPQMQITITVENSDLGPWPLGTSNWNSVFQGLLATHLDCSYLQWEQLLQHYFPTFPPVYCSIALVPRVTGANAR